MSTQWYECKVKYEKTLETGTQKKVTETYLIDALSCSEAESRIIAELAPYIVGEFSVKSVKEVHFSEMFNDPNGDKWYRAKVMFLSIDEKSGREVRNASYMLIQADSFDQAKKNLDKGMKDTMSDWELNTISETNIIDVLTFSAEEYSNKSRTENVPVTEEDIKRVAGCKLARRAIKKWQEKFVDADTGEGTLIERNQIIIDRLAKIEVNDYHLLSENGIKTITVYTDAPTYQPPQPSADSDPK